MKRIFGYDSAGVCRDFARFTTATMTGKTKFPRWVLSGDCGAEFKTAGEVVNYLVVKGTVKIIYEHDGIDMEHEV